MKTRNAVLLIFVFLWISEVCRGSEYNGTFDRDELSDRVALGLTIWQWWSAWEKDDLDAIRRLTAETQSFGPNQCVTFQSNRDCPLSNIEELFGDVQSRKWDVNGISVYRTKDTIVAFYDWTIQILDSSTEKDSWREGRAIDVFTKQGNKWRYVAQHLHQIDP